MIRNWRGGVLRARPARGPGALTLMLALVIGCSQPASPSPQAAPGADRASAPSAPASPAPAQPAASAPTAPPAPERFRYGTPSTSLNYYYLLFGEVEGL